MPHLRGYSALRRGRFSAPGFTYCLTSCAACHVKALTDEAVGTAIQEEILRMSSEQVWRVQAFTLMPDHIHILADPGDSLSLSQAVARLKAKTKTALVSRNAQWQVNYFDHRLIAGESILPVLLYVDLNPYRKQLIQISEQWPWFYCDARDWCWFKNHLTDNLPEPAWLL